MTQTRHINLIVTKLFYFVNSLCAVALLLSYFLPLISPKLVPLFSVLSLFVPLLIFINLFFLVYWLLKLKKHIVLSALVLGIGWFVTPPLFKIAQKKVLLNDDLKIMSYNVRMFNYYKWIKQDSIDHNILSLISSADPDILAIQEFHKSPNRILEYPYSYFVSKSKSNTYGLALFSKYKIINRGSLDFKESANNAIFIDVVKHRDTIRVYNIHLQSLKINTSKVNFGEKNSEKLIERLKEGFSKQVAQAEQFLVHEKTWAGKQIVCGDFNNTAYSWVYQQISRDKKDAYAEAGSGFGKSFNYFFPMRIDFILADSSAEINYFKTYNQKYSDHYPIMTRLNWN